MPRPTTFKEFAWLCTVVYEPTISATFGFARFNDTVRRASGFQGAIFRRSNGSGLDWVVAVTGTQPDREMGVDVVADAGFGGPKGMAIGLAATVVVPLLGPVLTTLSATGQGLLTHQCQCAEELVKHARRAMDRKDRVYITGHSLGGGIAQIISARTGVAAVAISSPAVTAVPGVSASWQRTHSPIVCLRVRNDPINQTGMLGQWLGRVVLLNSPRTGGDAHSILQTAQELSPQGQFTTLGEQDPFGNP